MPHIHRTSVWQLQIPEAWKAEGSGEAATFFRGDGLGMLMVLTDAHGPSDLSRDSVERYARESWPSDSTFSAVACGSLRGIAGARTERGTHWRGWWLPCLGRLVYASYQCAAAHADSERGEVDDILQTIAQSDNPAA
jgi:hypothetical protein